MIKRDDAEAVISMERYNELLEYEKLCKSGETYVWIWTGSLIGKSLTIGKVETGEVLAKEFKELSTIVDNSYNEIEQAESKINRLKRENSDLNDQLNKIKTKWWFKLFYDEKDFDFSKDWIV